MGYKHYTEDGLKDGFNLLLKAIDICESKAVQSPLDVKKNSISLCNLTEYYLMTKKNSAIRVDSSENGYRSIHGYGVCALCAKKIALTNKNELRRHVCSSSIQTNV